MSIKSVVSLTQRLTQHVQALIANLYIILVNSVQYVVFMMTSMLSISMICLSQWWLLCRVILLLVTYILIIF